MSNEIKNIQDATQPVVNPVVAQIDAQINQLVQEHQELTGRGQEYAQVIENINVRRHEIKGAVDTLNMLKGSLTGPQNVEDALGMGYNESDIETCGPDGMGVYKPNHCTGDGCKGDCCCNDVRNGDEDAGGESN